MSKPTEKKIKKLEDALLLLANFSYEHGELLKSVEIIHASPLIIKRRPAVVSFLNRAVKQLEYISNFQIRGRYNAGFVDPPDVSQKKDFSILKKKLDEYPHIKHIVDVGCFSGWVGRNLAVHGYRVLGIDVNPNTLGYASYLATGTSASYEFLESSRLGLVHPNTFDAAVVFDVMEHVFDHHVFLQSIELSLKEDGLVFISLPQYDEDDNVDAEPTDDASKEHLRAYDREEVEKVFKNKKDVLIEEYTNEMGQLYWFITYRK